jgi:cytochrome c556
VTQIAREFHVFGGCSLRANVAMRDDSAMLKMPFNEASEERSAKALDAGMRERILWGVMLCAMVQSAQCWAAEPARGSDDAAKSEALKAPLNSFAPADQPLSDAKSFSATEFRPRSHSIFAADPLVQVNSGIDAPMQQSTSVWQQMAEFKSQERVRLVTLWETRGSTISLQAGKHGGPSLQWSTPWMSRVNQSHGLLDQLFSTTHGIGSLRSNPLHPTVSVIAAKPQDSVPVAAK